MYDLKPSEFHQFLKALDSAPFEVDDWEAKFIANLLEQPKFTPGQELHIRRLYNKYRKRLKNF